MLDFPALMDFFVAEIIGNGLFGNVFDGVLFRYRIVQDEAAQQENPSVLGNPAQSLTVLVVG